MKLNLDKRLNLLSIFPVTSSEGGIFFCLKEVFVVLAIVAGIILLVQQIKSKRKKK